MVITGYDKELTASDKRLPLYIATVGELSYQNAVYRPTGIPDYQLLYTYSGEGRVKIKDADLCLTEGDILILPPFAPHDYKPVGERWSVAFITYNGLAAEECFGFSADVRRMSLRDFRHRYAAILEKKEGGSFCFDSSPDLYALLLAISVSESVFSEQRTPAPFGIKAAIGYISEHYTETIELSRLSSLAGMSDGHFCRSFKEHTHMRPIEYINYIRIEDAKNRLLSQRDATVASISASLGFESPVYFSKVFRSAVGRTPTEYRRG